MASTPENDIEQRCSLLDAWVETRRQIAALEARAMELLADRVRLCDSDARQYPHHRDTIHRSMIAEYAAAGHVSKGSVEYAFADAALLDADHPTVAESFRRGAITASHVREIVRAGSIVREAVREGRADAAALSMYDEAAVVVAERETPMRTRSLVAQIAAALAGATLIDRHRRAASERGVSMRSIDDGLALITIVLPEHLAAAVMDRLTRLAHQIIATRDAVEPPRTTAPLPTPTSGSAPTVEIIPPDTRTIDQLRADLFTDMLLTSDPTAATGTGMEHVQARIQVTISAATLAGADEHPAELDGHGPIDPDVARDLAAGSGGWSRLFLDPTGMVTETDGYTPTEAMRRFLRARDQHCRFPGCRMPVHRCQIDHNHDHALGGPTSIDNLSHFCVGHHVLKHPGIDDRHRWSAYQRTGGTIEWVSPIGRSYTDAAPRRVMFV